MYKEKERKDKARKEEKISQDQCLLMWNMSERGG